MFLDIDNLPIITAIDAHIAYLLLRKVTIFSNEFRRSFFSSSSIISSATFKGFPIEWHNVFVDSEMKGLNASVDFLLQSIQCCTYVIYFGNRSICENIFNINST